MPTLCPVAIAVGCRKCPVFAICPAKSLIGDQPPASARDEPASPAAKSKGKNRGKGSR